MIHREQILSKIVTWGTIILLFVEIVVDYIFQNLAEVDSELLAQIVSVSNIFSPSSPRYIFKLLFILGSCGILYFLMLYIKRRAKHSIYTFISIYAIIILYLIEVCFRLLGGDSTFALFSFSYINRLFVIFVAVSLVLYNKGNNAKLNVVGGTIIFACTCVDIITPGILLMYPEASTYGISIVCRLLILISFLNLFNISRGEKRIVLKNEISVYKLGIVLAVIFIIMAIAYEASFAKHGLGRSYGNNFFSNWRAFDRVIFIALISIFALFMFKKGNEKAGQMLNVLAILTAMVAFLSYMLSNNQENIREYLILTSQNTSITIGICILLATCIILLFANYAQTLKSGFYLIKTEGDILQILGLFFILNTFSLIAYHVLVALEILDTPLSIWLSIACRTLPKVVICGMIACIFIKYLKNEKGRELEA